MMKEAHFLLCDFDKIVNETYQLSAESFTLKNVESTLKVVKLCLGENHCYRINFKNKSLEIPKNWGVFATMRSGEFKKLSDLDKDFNSIFIDYFDLSAEIYLGMNDEGLYFMMREKVDEKKAA